MDALQAEDIDYARFQEHHLVSNRPCLIAGLVGSWPAFSLWTEPRSDGRGQKPRWDELERLYGDMDAPVVLESVRGIEREGCRTEKRFGDVLQRWRNLESALEDDDDRGRNERWYVKDWHLASNAATPLYSTPELFQDDWLNLYYTAHGSDDFRFVYMGERGTVTRIHRDVYASNSWSTNVLGVKKWTLFPPHVAHCLRRSGSVSPAAEMVDDVGTLASGSVDEKIFPQWKQAWDARIEVTQSAGESIFVPTGWYHQVTNMSPFVFSINHNWLNSSTFPSVYRAHCLAITDAEEAMSDVRELLRTRKGAGWEDEWIECVRGVVKADSGWDWSMLWACAALGTSVYRRRPDNSNLSTRTTPPSFPAAPAHLRPNAIFVAQQLAPSVDDFRCRREYAVSQPEGELRRTVDDLHQWISSYPLA